MSPPPGRQEMSPNEHADKKKKFWKMPCCRVFPGRGFWPFGWPVSPAGAQNWETAPETAQWTIFTGRDTFSSLALSDDGQYLWVSTNGGVEKHDAQTGELLGVYIHPDVLNCALMNLAPDRAGGLWAGSWGSGLVHLMSDGSRQKFDMGNSGLPSSSAFALLPDGSGGLWMGSGYSSLAHFLADGTWQVFDTGNSGLPGIWVETLLADGSGGVWAGTHDDGLAHLGFGTKQTAAAKIDDETLREKLFTDKRAAVLIHARAAENQESMVQSMAAHIYQTLQARGFDHDEIYFLSHLPLVDINNDGFPDPNGVDAPVSALESKAGAFSQNITPADVQAALDWAQSKGDLDQPLVFVFLGAGAKGRLLLDPSGAALGGAELDVMLDNYQTATGNTVVAILEAGYSGTLTDDLSASNRVVVASTSDSPAFYEDRGRIGFSHEVHRPWGRQQSQKRL